MSSSSTRIERCFVIGPIGDQLADPGSDAREAYENAIEVFENVIQAACAEFGIEAYRADNIDKPGEIPEQIFTALRDEDLVIADLSGANSNVMYELGLRHSTNKITIQIGEKGRLPFDVQSIRTIVFKRSPAGLVSARKALASAIGTSLAQGFSPPSATRVWLEGLELLTSSASMAALALDVSESESEEPLGALELVAEAEEAMPIFLERLARLNGLTVEMGALVEVHAGPVQSASTTALKLSAIHRFTVELEPLVKQFDQESLEFDSQVWILGAGVVHLIERVSKELSASGEAEREFVETLSNLGNMASGSREGMQAFHDSTEPLIDLSSKLRPIIRLLRSSLQRLQRSFAEVERWGALASEVEREMASDRLC